MSVGRFLDCLLRKSVAGTCLLYAGTDFRARIRNALGRLETDSGTVLGNRSVAETVVYVDGVYDRYRDSLAQLGISGMGKSVVEIGPGDNFGILARAASMGASDVHAVDRFQPKPPDAALASFYRAYSDRHDLSRVFAGSPESGQVQGLSVHAGIPAETFFAGRRGCFDTILSCAVLEHLTDPIKALRLMAAALKPGGAMVHVVDLRDHGMFSERNPLTFLTIPRGIYRWMSEANGAPNRIGFSSYRQWFADSGLTGHVRACAFAGGSPEAGARLVAQVRPRLARPFRHEADEDLAVASIEILVRRPA